MEIVNTMEARVQKDTAKSQAGGEPAQLRKSSESIPAALPKADRLTLSPEAQKKLAEQQKLVQQQEQTADTVKQMKEQLEVANAKAKAQAETMEKSGKCMTIAGRIMAGDTVPQGDERFLAKNDSELYMMAIMMRRMKENPRKYRGVADEETGGEPVTRSAAGETETEAPEVPPTTDSGGSAESSGRENGGEDAKKQ